MLQVFRIASSCALMIRCSKCLTFILLILLFAIKGAAQKKDSLQMGELSGILKDTVRNYVIQSATVAVYKPNDSKLLAYGLTNKSGQFIIKGIPVGTKLNFKASHIGYKTYNKEFYIPIDKKALSLNTLNMGIQPDSTLDEVVISAKPPVTLNGDTLEFNADAFHLDTNATLEDLMRKLTGVTIWSDGLITVNGVKVNNLYVDGKKFFGGDAKIALENLPKNSVEKVQVYKGEQQVQDREPDLNVNVVLKKDKKSGLFGKIGGGYGTDNRYVFDGMLSGFTPKSQLSIIGAHNNVNKIAGSVNALMQYSSFKGEGVDNEYSSDFSKPGLNIESSAGLHFAHEFKPENSLVLDHFYNKSASIVLRSELTVDNLGDNNQVVRSNNATNKSSGYYHKADGNYNLRLPNQTIFAKYNLLNSVSSGTDDQSSETENSQTSISTKGSIAEEERRKFVNVSANFKLENRAYKAKNRDKSFNYELDYTFVNRNENDLRQSKTDIVSSDVSSNQFFNRSYKTDLNNSNHDLGFKVPQINTLAKILPRFFNVNFSNRLFIYNSNEKAVVDDILKDGQYQSNGYLTNKSYYRTITEKPTLTVNKTFSKALVNRYNKSLSFQLLLQGELFDQKNSSDKVFQNIQRSYTNFLPDITISYGNQQVGRYESIYTLQYVKTIEYPDINQLAPLVDSSNIYFLHFGNRSLRPAKKHEFSVGVNHSITKSRNPGNGVFTITGGYNEDFIGDSLVYDELGRRILYNVNVSGNKYIGYKGYLSKIYQLKDSQVEFLIFSELNYANSPSFVNALPTALKSSNILNSFNVHYSYRTWLKFGGWQSIRSSSTKQTNSQKFNYTNYSTTTNTTINWPKKVYWNSNIAFNRSVSSFSKPINYTIWNASVVYRFLKGNNAELKFSALDLLRQNKAIINTGTNNSITRGTVNVLQQYFMFSVAYYPRIFGNIGGKKE